MFIVDGECTKIAVIVKNISVRGNNENKSESKREQAKLNWQDVQSQKMDCCHKYLDNFYDPACCCTNLIEPFPAL